MKTHAHVHRSVDRIELKEFDVVKFGVGLYIHYSFISPDFSKAGRCLFVSCAPTTQTRFAPAT